MDEEIKIELSNSSEELQRETQDIIRKIRQIEMQAESAIREWEKQIAHYTVSLYIDDLNKKYKEFPKVVSYLDSVKKDILENISHLAGIELDDSQHNMIYQIMLKKSGEENHYDKYRINLLVDNSRLKGAPVVIDYNLPTTI